MVHACKGAETVKMVNHDTEQPGIILGCDAERRSLFCFSFCTVMTHAYTVLLGLRTCAKSSEQ